MMRLLEERMRSGAAWGLALVLLFGASGRVRAQGDEADADVSPGDYQQALAPYGAWVDDGSYGHVWRPPVDEDWQPYVDGSWSWTGDGWTWESDEPWGWTFHYGRWALSPVFGWVWIPGDVWGPAWVDWFWGDGFVGWAPLSPFGGVLVGNFVFVSAADFCDPNLKHAVVDRNHVPRPIIDEPGARHRRPTLQQIARVTHHPVRLEARPPRTLAPWDRRDESAVTRSASVRQPGLPPSGSVTGALGPSSPPAGLVAGERTIPRTLRLGQPVLREPSPSLPRAAVTSVAPQPSQFRPPGFAPRPPAAPVVTRAPSGRAVHPPVAGSVSRGGGFPRSGARLQGHAARPTGMRRS